VFKKLRKVAKKLNKITKMYNIYKENIFFH